MKMTRMAVVGLVLAACLATLPIRPEQTAAAASSKEAMAAVDKMIGAMGGRKVLESIKDTTISGTVEIVPYGITSPITVYQKEPDKLRADITIAQADMTIIQAFDGRKGWMTDPQTGSTVEMPDFMAKDLARQASGNQFLLFPKKYGVTYALKPKATLEGKDYIVIEQTLADGHKTTFYLDPETYLPYKTQTRSLDINGAEVDSETYATDYREVGGTMVPYAARTVQNGSDAQRMTVASVTYNTNPDDAFFTLK